MYLRRVLSTALLALMLSGVAPATASADWLFTPFIGMNFSGGATIRDAFDEVDDEFENKLTYGATLAWMGAGIVGFEFDFGYSPDFFESTVRPDEVDFGDNNLLTLMGNVILGIPVGGQTGVGIRPYLSGGVGVIRSSVGDAADVFDISSNDWGFNVGAGVHGFFTDNVGIRGDFRYFRSLRDNEPDDEFDVALGALHFWRGTVGVTFRF
jgi:opacity protein-like surface antigen